MNRKRQTHKYANVKREIENSLLGDGEGVVNESLHRFKCIVNVRPELENERISSERSGRRRRARFRWIWSFPETESTAILSVWWGKTVVICNEMGCCVAVIYWMEWYVSFSSASSLWRVSAAFYFRVQITVHPAVTRKVGTQKCNMWLCAIENEKY